MKKLLTLLLLVGSAFAQVTNSARMLAPPNNQTGTTNPYVVQQIDSTRLTIFQNASAQAVTLAAGLTATLNQASIFSFQNLGPGTVTITCSGCLIYTNTSAGSATLTLTVGQGIDLYTNGQNYTGQVGGAGTSFGYPNGATMASIPPFSAGGGNLDAHTLVLRIPASYVQATGTAVKIGLAFYNIPAGTAVINSATIAATAPNPIASVGGFTYSYAWTTAPTAITWPPGSFANNSQVYFSNPVGITVDTSHDYYITIYLDPTNTADSPYVPNNSGPGITWQNLSGYLTGNQTFNSDASGLQSLSGLGVFGIQQVII